jgi:hypothetical protein
MWRWFSMPNGLRFSHALCASLRRTQGTRRMNAGVVVVMLSVVLFSHALNIMPLGDSITYHFLDKLKIEFYRKMHEDSKRKESKEMKGT